MAQTISRGEFGYRTANMNPDTARAFARCIACNSTRFTNVELIRAAAAKTEKFFVRFQPVNADRQGAIRQEQQEARADRALVQPFLFWQDPDNKNITWCYSVVSGETYQVTAADCSCPDFHYRCSGAGIRCKHMIARSLWRAAEHAHMISQDF